MSITIANIEFEPYRATLPTAVHQHPFGPQGRQCWLVRLTTSCGLTGVGDIAPWPGFSPSAADIRDGLLDCGHLFADRLVSRESLMSDFWTQFEDLPAVVRSGLELSMLDALSQSHQKPIAALLSSVHIKTVQTHRLVDNAGDAINAVANGYRTIKVKLSGDWRQDIERIGAIRAACPSTTIRLDANGAWTYSVARERLITLQEVGLDIVEQPVAAHDFDGLQKLVRDTHIRISADESTVLNPHRVIALEGLHEIVLKPAFLGGLATSYELGQRALAHQMAVCVTHSLESDIGRMGALHLAAALSADREFIHGLSLSGITTGPALHIPSDAGLRRAG